MTNLKGRKTNNGKRTTDIDKILDNEDIWKDIDKVELKPNMSYSGDQCNLNEYYLSHLERLKTDKNTIGFRNFKLHNWLLLEQMLQIYNYILNNPDVCLWQDFWLDITQKKLFPKREFFKVIEDKRCDWTILSLKREIDELLEYRIVKLGLNSKINTAFGIFMLKNNYGWSDKTQTETTITQKMEYVIPGTTIEEIDEEDDNKND